MKSRRRRNHFRGNDESFPRAMSCIIRVLLPIALLLVTAHRLPAPIQEVPEAPTSAPRLKPHPLPTASPKRANPARFAGSWTGKMKIGNGGDFDITLVVNPEATSLTQRSKRVGQPAQQHVHPTTASGHTLLWRGGQLDNVAWTLTPNPDGQTASAITNTGGIENTAVFRKVAP
jgi:hypothetical protein